MTKGKETSITPKRGAFPTPEDIMDAAKPYKPKKTDKSGPPGNESKSEPGSPEESRKQPFHDSQNKN